MFASTGSWDRGIAAYKNNAVSPELKTTGSVIDYSICAASGNASTVDSGVTSYSGNLSLSVTTNATNTSNNATYNTTIDIRPAFIRAYIWKRTS